MTKREFIPGFLKTLFTVLIMLLLCNVFFGYLGYDNSQLVSELNQKEVILLIGSVAIFGGLSAGISVYSVDKVLRYINK